MSDTVAKKVPHRFQPGTSGNPSGVNGYTKARQRMTEEALEQATEQALRTLARASKRGDPVAAANLLAWVKQHALDS